MSEPGRRPDGWAPPPQQYGWAPLPGPPAQYPPPGYFVAPVDPRLVTGLPIEERSYSSFYRAPRWRWWKPLLATALTIVAFVVFATVFTVIGLVADGTDIAGLAPDASNLRVGPGIFLANNIALAMSIPTAMLVQWLFTGQRPRWLSSVQGRFRWGWFGTCVAVALPLWLALMGIETALTGLPPDIQVRPYTVVMIAGILLTTPFQAAGEEYLMRGLEQRFVASYFRSDLVGFLVGALVSSLTFMALHGAADPWLNAFYFGFGGLASWLTWRTGGLEAAVAIHVVNNMVSEALLPFTDFSDMFDRSAGVGDPTVLIHLAVLLGATIVMAWLAKRRGLPRASAPGRAEVERVQAVARSAWAAPSGR